MSFPFDRLRRFPDIEGPGLMAADAADRLILDESSDARGAHGGEQIVVIGDAYGALALAAATGSTAGIVRVHQDALLGEQALASNAQALGLSDRVRSLPLGAELLTGARVVLLRLPRSLEELRDIAGVIAAYADPEVAVFAGGRLKHMSVAMNAVLGEVFETVDVSHARQKSRVLIARGPHDGRAPEPARGEVDGLTLCAFGGVFAGARLDIGTRLLLETLPDELAGGTPTDPWIDLACGSGVIGSWLALDRDGHVYSCDQSAAAVASAAATAAANRVSDLVSVARDDALSARADGSASVIVLNPPFHSGSAVTERIAPRLFAEAARVLRPGGQLWCVWNSPLGYRGALERIVGPTEQRARNAKFTVTVSTRRAPTA